MEKSENEDGASKELSKYLDKVMPVYDKRNFIEEEAP